MRALVAGALLVGFAVGGVAQEIGHRFDPRTSYSVFAEYSNDSSHIIIGQAENRKLFAVGASFNRRLHENRVAAWRYQLEIEPLMLLRNPRLAQTLTVTAINGVYPISAVGVPPGTYSSVELSEKQCSNASGSGYFVGQTSPYGPEVPVWAYSYSAVCSNPWTYGGGVSPLGQKVNFLPRARVQPYAAFNAGFVAFARAVPAYDATMFNFSFEFGGGVEWNVSRGRRWGLDYRYHHISNAGRGNENPGVDNGTFRISYGFGR